MIRQILAALRRRRIERQTRYVAELEVAYDNHTLPDYWASLTVERAKLAAMVRS